MWLTKKCGNFIFVLAVPRRTSLYLSGPEKYVLARLFHLESACFRIAANPEMAL